MARTLGPHQQAQRDEREQSRQRMAAALRPPLRSPSAPRQASGSSRAASRCVTTTAPMTAPTTSNPTGAYQNLAELRAAAPVLHNYNHHWRVEKLRYQSPIEVRRAFQTTLPLAVTMQ